MRKLVALSILLTLVAIAFSSCKKDIKVVNVKFELDGHGNFTANGQKAAIIEEDGIDKEKLNAMVKNNVMKIYIQPDNVLTENEPTSLVVNGYQEKAFEDNIYGTLSATYRILFEFEDGLIKVTPNITEIDNHYFDTPDDNFPSYVFWTYTNCTGKFQKEHLREKASVERFIDSVVNNLLWGVKDNTANIK